MAQVQVGLGAVVGDEDLAVLQGAHGTRVHVHVGVQLLAGHLEAAALQQSAQRGGGDAFAQTGDDAAGDEDEFCHKNGPPLSRLILILFPEAPFGTARAMPPPSRRGLSAKQTVGSSFSDIKL